MSTPYGPVQVMDELHDLLTGHVLLAGVLRVAHMDDAPNVDPPMVVVGPPSWSYHSPAGEGVAEYALAVYVVEANGERALRDLLTHTALVARVLDEPPGLAVRGGRPTSFPAGAQELPAYAIDLGVTA